MKVKNIIENSIHQNENSIWILDEHKEFAYSDGVSSEQYLSTVFDNANDLSSESTELESYIKDWASEYHLSSRRAQLLSSFDYDESSRVLEVGCGCGAITSLLGERFKHVVSIEGSIERAKLARKRTQNNDNVDIVCAPFQKINFKENFDIIFCIGVFEYSGSFVEGETPYESVLKYFGELLADNGVLVLAIENQFGLKYFTSSREDHVGRMFEGIEGYHKMPSKVKTFGRHELKNRLQRHFSDVKFYYPYSDYKMPDSILSEEFLESGHATELIARTRSRDYKGSLKPMFDELTTTLELSKNNQLNNFSNSFLIVAGKAEIKSVTFNQLGVFYTSKRKRHFKTKSIIRSDNGKITIDKRFAHDGNRNNLDANIALLPSVSNWQEGYSINTHVYLNSKSMHSSLEEIFAPAREAVLFLRDNSTNVDNESSMVEGKFIDATWSNLYCDSGICEFIDQEWLYHKKIKINVIVLRSIYRFLSDHQFLDSSAKSIRSSKIKQLIVKIADSLDIDLSESDFIDFIKLETELYSTIFDVDLKFTRRNIELFLLNRKLHFLARSNFEKAKSLSMKIKDIEKIKGRVKRVMPG